MDYVPMPGWKNALINLLNIAGSGPILGPIQGILFGPIALITIPIGCVIGGAMHDYFSGMIAVRDGGAQMPETVGRYTNKAVCRVFTVFVCLVLFLVGVAFIYTPGDIAATQVFGFGGTAKETSTWVIYSVIFVYYPIATIFPIDKIIGKIYPLFGAILVLSAVGIFAMLLIRGYALPELWQPWTGGGAAALIGVIVLPITSGDTALRALRLMIVDTFHIRQDTKWRRFVWTLPIFAVVCLCLIAAKVNPAGFNVIWRYFGWSNQTLSVFTLSCVTISLMWNGRTKYLWMPLISLMFYAFVTFSYLLSSDTGFGLPYPIGLACGGVFALLAAIRRGIAGEARKR